MDINDLRWDNIAFSDAYRKADPGLQNRVKSAWMREAAPILYPQVRQDPRAMHQLVQQVNKTTLPAPLENEEHIIRPETLTINGITKMETNPAFAEKPFKEQYQLRQVWFRKMARQDPEFQSLSPEEQEEYYKNTLKRPPSYQVFDKHPAFEKFTGFFTPIDPEYDGDLSIDYEKVLTGTQTILQNFTESFAGGFASLVTGPVKLLAGEDSAISQALMDIQKERKWVNTVNTEHEFVRETIPSIVGFGAGLITGPFSKFENIFAGTSTLTKAAGKRSITQVPGLFEKVGTKVTSKIPSLGYRVAGGATAGAVQGVTQAISEGKPWHSYLAADATLGVGFEFLSRYLGAVRQIKKVAKDANIGVDDILRQPFKVGEGIKAPEEITNVLRSNPDMEGLVQFTAATDKDGMILRWINTEDGVKTKSDLLGFKTKKVGDHLEIHKGAEKVKEFNGPLQKQVREANDFLDLQDGAWEKALKGKTMYEAVATAPQIQMRRAQFVPTQARKLLLKRMQENNVFVGADYSVDPRGDTTQVDKLFGILYDNGPKKASDTLKRMGIVFDEVDNNNKAIIRQMKSELEQIMPKEPFLYVNSRNKNVVAPENMPKVYVEHPEMQQPFYNSNVFSGNPRSIRNIIDTIKSTEKSVKTKISKQASGTNVEVFKMGNHSAYEIEVKLPTESGGVREALLHFPTEKSVYDFLQKGKYRKGAAGLIEEMFEGDDALQQAYKKFTKAFKTSDPKKFKEEALPFQFAAKMAKDKGYALGIYKGKYVIQDALDINDVRFTSYDSLQDAMTFLKEMPPHVMRPSLLGNVSDDALEQAGLKLKDPLDDIPYEEVKRTRKFSVSTEMAMKLRPTQYAIQAMEKLETVQYLREHFDFSPTRIYNLIEDSHRAQAAMEQGRRKWIKNIQKGVKKEESEYMTDWIESLSDQSERKIQGVDYRLKVDVEDEMAKQFGRPRTDQLLEKATQLEQFYEELFSMSDIPWSSLIKHYIPHFGNQLAKVGAKLSTPIDVHSMTQIPKTHQSAFFEFLRDVDPRDVVWERDAFKLAEIYNHLSARNAFVRPTLDNIKGELQHVLNSMKHNQASNDDYKAVTNYISNLMGVISGVDNPSDRRLKYAVQRSNEEIQKYIIKQVGGEPKNVKGFDPISKLITIATGAHLAARPFPVLRNLTQSLVTGSFIGPRWWMEGADEVMNPGSLKRMMDMGVIESVVMPTGAGFSIDPNSIIAKGMQGYKWADWINRGIVYLGTEKRFNNAVEGLKSGKLSKKKFFRNSGMKLFGNTEFNEMARIYNTSSDKDAALRTIRDRVANKATSRSQYLYTRFDHPEAFRSSIGRLFGQYTSWPLNYFNFVRSMISADSLTVVDKAQMLGGLGAVTYGLARGANEAGISPDSFLPWKMGIMSPGPYFQMITDGMQAANGDQQSMNSFINNITSILPFVYEGEGIWKSAQALQDGDMYEALLHVMSAPVNYDLYPHRTTPIQAVRDAMNKGGQKYVEFQQESPFQE